MNKIVKYSKDKIILDVTLEKKLKKYLELEKELKPILTEIKSETIDIMNKTDNKIMKTSLGIIFKFKSGYTKTSLNTTALKENDFDIYKEYLETSTVSDSVNISLSK